MKEGKQGGKPRRWRKILLFSFFGLMAVIFIVIPLLFAAFDGSAFGNVALIPINGQITVEGEGTFGSPTVSSSDIVTFIAEADEAPGITAIVLEINSPGGSAVASDEIATAAKKAKKPVVALIREAGASGGYWIASDADHIIANRMSITGSIGVVSSYLEFSGLMEKYGVKYERMVSGKYKDTGSPLKDLTEEERMILQRKLDRIHGYFIDGVAENRNLAPEHVASLATGEFFLGVEALEAGLVDELGDADTVKEYLKKTYGLETVDFVRYEHEPSFIEALTGVFADASFRIGEGIGSRFFSNQQLMLS